MRGKRFLDSSLTPLGGRLVVSLRDGVAVAGEAFRRGYRRVHLTTCPRRPEARGLYLAAGYTPLFDVTVSPSGPLPFEKRVAGPVGSVLHA